MLNMRTHRRSIAVRAAAAGPGHGRERDGLGMSQPPEERAATVARDAGDFSFVGRPARSVSSD
jgi:hypothetical protein